MKTNASSLLLLCLLLLIQSVSAAAPKAPPPTPTVSEAIGLAENHAARAILAGDLKAAQGWSTVAMQLRAGAYLAPFGELASQFTAQLKNLPSFVAAAMVVESTKPTLNWWSNRYQTAAIGAIIRNDPEAFKLALARQTAWETLRHAYDHIHGLAIDKGPTPEELQAVEAWIEGRTLPTDAAETKLVTQLVESKQAQPQLAKLLVILRETPGVASK